MSGKRQKRLEQIEEQLISLLCELKDICMDDRINDELFVEMEELRHENAQLKAMRTVLKSHQLSDLDVDVMSAPALQVPVLEVPGVSQDKIHEVLTQYLEGKAWRNVTGNYNRTVKPIKEKYEMYLRECSAEGDQKGRF